MKVQYCKISDLRSKQYQIATRICQDGSHLWVEKESLFPEGVAHVRGFIERKEILERLYKGRCVVAPCEVDGSVARFQYMEGQPFERKMLSQIAASSSSTAAARVFDEWFDIIRAGEDNRCPFVKTQQFVDWFGDVSGLEGVPSLKVCNFDCSSDNLIVCDEALAIIDYEWVFSFPIPESLIFYRLLKRLYDSHPWIGKTISVPDLLQACHVDTDIGLLEKMVDHFYQAIDLDPQTGISARKMTHKFDEQSSVQSFVRSYRSSIYYDIGGGFSEEHKSELSFNMQESGVRWSILLPQGCKAVRLDPVEGFFCLVKNLLTVCDRGACTVTPLNGRLVEDDIMLFDNTDPQILITPPEGVHKLEVTAAVYPAAEVIWKQLLENMADSQRENECLKRALLETNTKESDYDRLLAEIQAKDSIYDRLLAEKAAIEADNGDLARQTDMLGQQLRLSQKEARIWAAQYSAIANSQFWGITAPLRKTLDAVKRTRMGYLTYRGIQYWRTSGFRAAVSTAFAYLNKKRVARRPVAIVEPVSTFAKLALDFAKGRDTKIYLNNVLKGYDSAKSSKILIISHELNLTGGPIAAMRLVECLKENGYLPVVVSPHDGPLSYELEKRQIPALVSPHLYTSDVVRRFAGLFDVVVANTVVSAPAVTALYGLSLPVLWWIHEAEASYHSSALQAIPQFPSENVHVYAGGGYAKERLLSHRPGWDAKELLYYVPDMPEHAGEYMLPSQAQGKTVFACIGMVEQRKGQDIFVQALESVPEQLMQKGYYVFVGRQQYLPSYQSIMALCGRYPENVQYIEELPVETLLGLYRRIDCLVCCSLDDPMPIVVAEAMAASKLIICSEHTGSATILREDNSGLVYYNDDPRELARCITRVLEHGKEMDNFRIAARSSYETHFSNAVFTKNLLRAIGEIQAPRAKVLPLGKGREFSGMVSVVIPVYNAGPAMETLLKRLLSQKGIPQVEVVVVDSGSTDGTPVLCRKYGARVLEILNSEFSHSYARNLGAKAAQGDILLFMTQDALPRDENWIHDLTAPILSGEASAVSCREKCPEGTDLYYQISSWNHAGYLGIQDGDRCSQNLEPNETMENMRKKASLSDVSTAIDAQVFCNFYYRFNYAEDLDLGMRLLIEGYAVKLMGTLQTIHGHNRPAGYYLKRFFVEAKALASIYPEWRAPRQTQDAAARKVTVGAGLLSYALEKTLAGVTGPCETDTFIATLQENLLLSRENKLTSDYVAREDKLMAWCLQVLEPLSQEARSDEAELFNHVCYYLDHFVWAYLNENEPAMLEQPTQAAVCGCLMKRFCAMSGSTLAGIEPSEPLYETLQVLSKGV